MPERIQLSRAKGWRMPPNTVNVARPGRWGNPYAVWRDDDGQWLVTNGSCHWPVQDKAAGITLAVEKHASDCNKRAAFYGGASILAELRGKNLACWCKPGAPCHADTLLRLANPGATS